MWLEQLIVGVRLSVENAFVFCRLGWKIVQNSFEYLTFGVIPCI